MLYQGTGSLLPCPNLECSKHGQSHQVIRFGFYRLKRGRRRRYRCGSCRKTYGRTTHTYRFFKRYFVPLPRVADGGGNRSEQRHAQPPAALPGKALRAAPKAPSHTLAIHKSPHFKRLLIGKTLRRPRGDQGVLGCCAGSTAWG